jgi:nucleotide-binding universal stress UspA family protein
MVGAPAGYMVTFRHVLCPIDFSEPSQRALAYAVAFADWHKARLAVMHVAPTFEPSLVPPVRYDEPGDVVFPVQREEVLEALHRMAKAAGASPSRVDAVAEAGGPASMILDRAVSWPADLLVIGTHGRSGLDRALLGSVAERVMHKAPCAVLTVPPAAHAASASPLAIRRILCPVDFSPSSLVAVGFALDLARQVHAAVTLLHVVDWPTEGEPLAHAQAAAPEFLAFLLADGRERLQAVVPPEASDVEVALLVVAGRAKREILRHAADQDSDIILMGAQGRDGFGLTLLGSTTERVVRAAACPVLTVRGVAVSPS